MEEEVEEAQDAQEPFFRSNKRRKVILKRRDGNDNNGFAGDSSDDGNDNGDRPNAKSAKKPPTARKRGIAFSNTIQPREQQGNTETALVLATMGEEQPAVFHNDRFVRPTGRAGVADDRHLTAYIDSKLAETNPANKRYNAGAEETPEQQGEDQRRSQTRTVTSFTQVHHIGQAAKGKIEEVDLSTWKGRKGRPTTSARRVESPPDAVGRSAPRRRRHHYDRQPDPSTLARSSLVDQILAESHVPMYERRQQPASSSPLHLAQDQGGNHGNGNGEGDGDGEGTPYYYPETDEAVAEAFKKQFLAEIEERNRRARPPAKPHEKSAPKLGGSRAQRERMAKAAAAEEEAAKAKAKR